MKANLQKEEDKHYLKWLSVYNDLSQKDFRNKEEAFQSGGWYVIKVYVSDTFTLSGIERLEYTYQPVDENESPIFMKVGKWSLEKLKRYFFREWRWDAYLIDPEGTRRTVYTDLHHTLEMLQEVRKLANWQTYDLLQENKKLKYKNEILKQDHRVLLEQINELKNNGIITEEKYYSIVEKMPVVVANEILN